MQNDYVPTPSLPDNRGRALIAELRRLGSALERDPETGRAVRRNSNAERSAFVALQAAVAGAAIGFTYYRDFVAWLDANGLRSPLRPPSRAQR